MAAVRFGFGIGPGPSKHDALDLAELLMRTRSIAGLRAGGKVRRHAKRNPDDARFSEDAEPDPDELQVLAQVLAEDVGHDSNPGSSSSPRKSRTRGAAPSRDPRPYGRAGLAAIRPQSPKFSLLRRQRSGERRSGLWRKLARVCSRARVVGVAF
jgi:hypothetical protein